MRPGKVIVILILGLCAGLVYADQPYAVTAEYGFVDDVEFKTSRSKFDFQRAGFKVSTPYVDLSYTQFNFDWTDAGLIDWPNTSSSPWKTLHGFTIEGNYAHNFSQRTRLIAGLGASLGWEDNINDSLSILTRVGIMHKLSPSLDVRLGIEYNWHQEVKTRYALLPYIGVLWNEGAETGFSGSIGVPETSLRYGFSARNALSLKLGVDDALASLSSNNEISPGGFVEFNRINMGLYFRHCFTENWRLAAGVNYSVDTEIRLFDQNGKRFLKEKLEHSPGLLLKLKFSFKG